jgi:hypothetical protein
MNGIHIFANHAPVWVFVLLGFVVGAIALVLYFANAVGGGDKDTGLQIRPATTT